ncbi:hypothetical protein HerbRD11066_73290 [Herbidospora sp. RD11066]
MHPRDESDLLSAQGGVALAERSAPAGLVTGPRVISANQAFAAKLPWKPKNQTWQAGARSGL